MVFLFVLLTVAIIVGGALVLSTFIVMKKPKSDQYYLDFLEKIKNEEYSLNMYDSNIISIKTKGILFISRLPEPCWWFSQYYISDNGFIPVWYKSHDEIKKMFEELNNK